MRNITRSLWTASILFIVFTTSCRKDATLPTSKYAFEYSGDFVQYWFSLQTKFIKETPGFFPPQAARALGYSSIALHEAVVHGMYAKSGKPLAGQLNGLQTSDLPAIEANVDYNWAITANAAMAEISRLMFAINITAANSLIIEETEKQNLNRFKQASNAGNIDKSVAYGRNVAKAIYEYSKSDKGHQVYLAPFQLPYTLPTGDDKWVPTGAATNPLSPKWGENRPFLRQNIADSLAPMMLTFSSMNGSEFWREANEVAEQTNNNTPEQKVIAQFWADDPVKTFTPPGHSFNILSQLLAEQQSRLDKCAVAYAKMGIAENDAFVKCWRVKYQYNSLRPVTYIRRYINPNFTPLLATPAFPSYMSGHATEGAAAAQVLSSLFGKGDGKYPFTDRSQMPLNLQPRAFQSFDQMAQECADSRFYGGIHYQHDNKNGLICGKKIGNNVNTLVQWSKYTQ